MKLVKNLLQYMVPLLLAGALLLYAYRDTDFGQLATDLAQVNYGLLAVSLVPMIAAHAVRANRWRDLLRPLGYVVGLGRSFGGVMSGYFANLILPRMGEVVRCGILQRTSAVPVSVSLGTVIAERAIDVVMLLFITLVAFLLEWNALSDLFGSLLGEKSGGDSGGSWLLPALAVVGVVSLAAVWLMRNALRRVPLIAKIFDFLGSLAQGVLSVGKLERPGWFVAQSFIIWGLYCLTGWLGLLSLPDTAHLGLLPAFILLVTGSYGMVAPVQGGIGAYHYMVGITLTQLYMLSDQSAKTAALLLHTSQTLVVVVVGGLSYLVSILVKPAASTAEAPAKATA